MRISNKRGFTLIELIMVIVIIGILAAIAIPTFVNLILQANNAAVQGSLGGFRSAVAIQYANSAIGGANPTFPTLAALQTGAAWADGQVPLNILATTRIIAAGTPANCAALVVVPGVGATAWQYTAATGRVWATTNSCANSNSFNW